MHVNISVTVKVVGGFLYVMAKNWGKKIKRNYLHFHRFFLCVINETRSLLTNISLVVKVVISGKYKNLNKIIKI